MTMFVIVGIVAVVLFMLVSAAVKIVQEYEQGVIFRLGRLVGAWCSAQRSASGSRTTRVATRCAVYWCLAQIPSTG
jgi:uncharacterized membrane protein YecN with MAPEG domain